MATHAAEYGGVPPIPPYDFAAFVHVHWQKSRVGRVSLRCTRHLVSRQGKPGNGKDVARPYRAGLSQP